jgi:hypothetical protein
MHVGGWSSEDGLITFYPKIPNLKHLHCFFVGFYVAEFRVFDGHNVAAVFHFELEVFLRKTLLFAV